MKVTPSELQRSYYGHIGTASQLLCVLCTPLNTPCQAVQHLLLGAAFSKEICSHTDALLS